MISMFYDIHMTVMKAVDRAEYPVGRTISILGISRYWYYGNLSISPLLDRRFNPFAAGDEEWIVIRFKHRNPAMSHREIVYTLMDEDLAYFSPSTVYNILKRHNLITPWNRKTWASTRPEHAKQPDEKWQTDIMCIKIVGRFVYLIIFIDEYSGYIVHYALLTSMDTDSVSTEAQTAIEKLRKDSLPEPVIQSDNGSSFIAMEFKIVLRENHLT